MSTCPPLVVGDVAVTHLPGEVTVSTRRTLHVGASSPDALVITWETAVLVPGVVVDAAQVDEAWTLKQEPGAPHPGVIAEHPDRIEQRFAWLVAADGSTKVLTRTRGEDPEFVGEWKDGRLIHAVRDLLTAALDG